MKCSLCDASPREIIARSDSKSGRPLGIYFCHVCGFVQQLPVPTDEELSRYYATEYRSDYKGTLQPKAKHVHRAARSALRRLDHLRSHGIVSGTLLDIGAGGGEFVEICNRSGFDAEGIDPNQGYSEYARREYGARIHTGELANANGSYDVVTMFHVLEHLPSPVDVFRRLYDLVKPGGRLLIEVPWALSGSVSPSNLYFKAHLHYFDIETLAACASGHFKVTSVSTDSNLLMLFERLPEPVKTEFPRAGYVETARRTIRRNGWTRYLLTGGSYRVPLRKLKGLVAERTHRHFTGRQIIDSLVPPR